MLRSTIVKVSVIIPTFNRRQQLRGCLNALSCQEYPTECFEAIVVDDGSTDGTEEVAHEHFPFLLKYVKQENRGATNARNAGALESRGGILIFIDDDVMVSSNTLKVLDEVCSNCAKTIALGKIVPYSPFHDSVFGNLMVAFYLQSDRTKNGEVHFTECNTELLALRKSEFFELQMFQDHTGGWPNWDDVDFGYRAHRSGFRFYRARESLGQHWDYTLASLAVSCDRMRRASKSAVLLFEQYPELRSYLPMFSDMTMINWRGDSMRLIVRKVARRLVSADQFLKSMGLIVNFLERYYPSPMILYSLYRWIVGSYIYRGYRDGLREQAMLRNRDGVF